MRELVPMTEESGAAATSQPSHARPGQRRSWQKRKTPVGPSSDAVNEAAAYVRLTPKSLGDREQTLLLAQRHCDASTMFIGAADSPESVSFGGKVYDISLCAIAETTNLTRLTLQDIRKNDYIGTAIPRDYSSYVTLNDPQRGVKNQEVRIWMNNPLRYAGETFYQSGYHPLPDGEATSLQLVTNFGWMIPYVACMLSLVGLVWHFGATLTRFLDRERGRRARRHCSARIGRGTQWLASAVSSAGRGIDVVCAAILCGAWRPKPTIVDGMNLTEFGQLPVIFQGRAKPLDTLARNTLKVVSNKQSYADTTLE